MAICLVSDRDKGVAVLWRGFMRDRFYKVGKVSDMYDLLQIALTGKHFIADVIFF